MAKRRKHDDEELPFVALMDTMTNVVGVLVIVLVMVGLSITNTVKQILSDLPPVTVEQLQELLAKMKEPKTPQKPEDIQKKIEQAEKTIKSVVDELKTIDLTAVQQNVKFMDLDDLRKKLENAKKERDARKGELDKLFAELDRLKKALDDIPVYKPPPPKYVRIPNPRPVPQGAVRENFLIVKGRVIYLNDRAFLEAVTKEFEKNRTALIGPGHPKITSSTPPASIKYNKDKVFAYFDKARIGDRILQARVVPIPNSPAVNMSLTPAPGAGESDQDLRNPASIFQRALRKFKGEPNKIVWFYVYKDSVETYLTAREIADAAGVPVGWQIYGQEFFTARIPNVTIEPFTPPPPPATPPVKSEIAAPKDQLD